jgi:hypothetical protein
MENEMQWDIDVSILTNSFIVKELLKVLGIASLFTIGIVFLITLPSILDGHFYFNSSNSGSVENLSKS